MIDVPPELTSFLKEEYDRCRDESLDDERTTAIDRYNGEPYGDEEEGSSQVVSRATSETIDYMTISIMRAIESGDRVVEFLHKDSDKAHEATETIMHLLMDEQDGYRILHDWLKAGLLEKTATAAVYIEERPKKRKELMLSASELAMAAQHGIEFIEAEETGEVDEQGEPSFNVVTLEERGPKFCTAAIPNEEFYCSPDARTITEAALKGRKVRKTVSQLVQMGIDKTEAESIGEASNIETSLSGARDQDRVWQLERRKGGNRVVWWHEEFARFDLNGDGIAELLYIQRAADYKIFSIDEMEDEEDHPFEDWCPFPMQHRRIGQSLADKTMDLERIDTVLMRQTLNGIYIANSPSTYLNEASISDNTVDDLLSTQAGRRIIRWQGAIEPKERQGGFDPSIGFGAMEFIDKRRETRTGITRLNQGLDDDTLNQTAKGQASLMNKGEQIEEYIARNFANALARLITKLARLLQHYGKPLSIPIDGTYVDVDPTKWPEDMIARARLGLGSSRKDQRLAFRREVIGMQSAALEAGLSIVDDSKFYNSAKGFIADARLGDASEFFIDPDAPPEIDKNTGQPKVKEEKPDPEAMKVQAELQMQQAKMQGEQQIAAAKLQTDQQAMSAKLEMQQQEAALKLQLQREQAEAEAQLARDKAAVEGQLAQQKMDMEWQLAERRMQMEERLSAHKASLAEAANDAKISQNRSGGSLAE